MDYFMQGFGVFLGVLAGIVISIVERLIMEKRMEAKKIRNLKLEMHLNINKFNKWLEEITKYRNAVASDSLQNYYGYFDLGKYIFTVYNDLFITGIMYNYLSYEDINSLQIISSEISYPGETFINNQLRENKERLFELIENESMTEFREYKSKVVQDIIFWENKFKTHKDTLEKICERVK